MNSIMKNKVYYGEYSLSHWIKLIMKKDIILPDYQRYFVWKEDQIESLISTLKEGYFIPPIIIGACIIDGKNENIIIDGQQRLTSVLLAYLQAFPKPDKFKEEIIGWSDSANVKRWTFKELTQSNKSIEELRTALKDDNRYKPLEIEITEEKLNSTYIGFSYIIPEIPDDDNQKAQQNYYSTIFRSINQQGTKLRPVESRKALYFLDTNLVKWFEPNLEYKVEGKSKMTKIPLDFIRYISVLTEYYKRHVVDKKKIKIIDLLPSDNTEKYYERYIYTYTGMNDENEDALGQFGKIDEIFTNGEFLSFIEKLKKNIDDLDLHAIEFKSIIALDIYFYGLVYYLLFEKKEINLDKKKNLLKLLARYTKQYTDNTEHSKSPNSKTYWAERIETSIRIYKRYLK